MKKLILLVALVLTVKAFGEDHAYLDAPYKNLTPPIDDSSSKNFKNFKAKSETLSVIELMTPVKSQGSRGTCSIFSATAMLEAMLVIGGHFENTIDLSEEWLEFLVIAQRRGTTDGSSSQTNFALIFNYGMPYEATLPYESDKWGEFNFSNLQRERCSHLAGNALESCYLSHFDYNLLRMSNEEVESLGTPYALDYLTAKKEARKNRNEFIKRSRGARGYYNVGYTSSIKAYLDQGIPLTLGAEFFYGAWNHRKATEYGIGRDLEAWDNGVVGFPEYGSVDYKKSKENRAGHSVLVVGYDDEKIVTTNVLMEDGTYKEFTYKGVYYFKNSWGTTGFGKEFMIDGKLQPGYGMITQKYAHRYGSFYQMPLRAKPMQSERRK